MILILLVSLVSGILLSRFIAYERKTGTSSYECEPGCLSDGYIEGYYQIGFPFAERTSVKDESFTLSPEPTKIRWNTKGAFLNVLFWSGITFVLIYVIISISKLIEKKKNEDSRY